MKRATLLIWAAFIVSCGGTVRERGRSAPDGGGLAGAESSSAGGAATADGASFGSGGAGIGAGTGASAGSGGQQCTDFYIEAEPVDVYLMFDQSQSMIDPLPGSSPPISWWGAAQNALANLVQDPRAAGRHMGVDIQYFPLDGGAPQSCAASYETPEVEIGLLPGNVAPLLNSIQSHQPTGFTPTAPALEGAIAHMKQWAPAHPAREPVVVLVTDGFPSECDPTQIADVAAIAKVGVTTEPRVHTFVVAFNMGLGSLSEIASQGGTDRPYLIEGGDVSSKFTDALLSIAATQLACSFVPRPADPTVPIDVGRLVIEDFSSATGVPQELPRMLQGLGDCAFNGNMGWYDDSTSSPTKIVLCPGTCDALATSQLSIIMRDCPQTLKGQ